MKKILITNDDGIDADGLIRLAQAAKNFGEVWIVAPDGQRSAMSHSISLRHPVEVWECEFPVSGVHAYACDGTPADCVRIGVLNIVPGKPDHVFSGINYGYNTATDL
ncbi:MAG: 5'/3'-nucleotidase SurE, partial [Lachnospiraceae bacterium]|nr:5'/3'-nucleotidase SurE [Lachnospiraceae bacterium]